MPKLANSGICDLSWADHANIRLARQSACYRGLDHTDDHHDDQGHDSDDYYT